MPSAGTGESLESRGEQLGGLGTWEWVLDPRSLRWSDNLYRIYGLEPGELEPTTDYLLEHIHPDDRDRVAAALRVMGTRDGIERVDYRYLTPDGVLHYLRAAVAVADTDADGRPTRLLGSVQDVTQWRAAERGLAAQEGVARALDRWRSLRQDGRVLLEALGDALGASMAILRVPARGGFTTRAFWLAEDLRREAPPSLQEVPKPGDLADRVMRARRPVTARQAGHSGCLAFPVIHQDAVLAVVELHLPDDHQLEERLARTVTGIGYQLGHFFDRRRSELDAEVLAPRELEVIRRAAQGASVAEIAGELHLSASSVKRTFEGIYTRMGVSDRAAAVAVALRTGLIR